MNTDKVYIDKPKKNGRTYTTRIWGNYPDRKRWSSSQI